VTATIEVRAEVLKLARLLGSEPERLAYLQQLEPEDVRWIRERATDVLFDSDARTLQRVAAASRLLPVPLVAAIAERAFGPLLCARVAGLMDASRAVEVGTRLPPAFLADVAVAIDPRRASDVIAQTPPHQIVVIARELLRRREFVTMGRFVGHLEDEALEAALEVIDDAALLRIAFVLEQKDRLGRVVGLLPPGRLGRVLRAAADEGLWLEALELLEHVPERRRGELTELAAQLPADFKRRLAEQARAAGVLDGLGDVVDGG
jgi:hypothetical protein